MRPATQVMEYRAPARAVVLLRLMRVHQWVKNLLVFVPLLTAHELTQVEPTRAALVAFVAFSFCASGIYIINDLYDLDADRQHPEKRHRPLAAREITIPRAILLTVVLVGTGAALASSLPAEAVRLIGLYVGLSVGYSYILKEIGIVDVLTLAGLYTLRVLVGGAAARIE